jgi:signal peptidase I
MGSRTGKDPAGEATIWVPPPKGVARELAETILFCVLAVVFLRAFVFQQSEIPSGSMETTILIGDHVLVNRFIYAPTTFDWERELLPIRDIRRGDIVVFKHPTEPEQDFIKRVIGLPGDTVELRRGALWVNGLPVDEPYLDPRERRGGSYGPEAVEPGHYFLMGDNRSRSSDSRVWGQASRALIKGRAFLILFSTETKPEPGQPPGQVTPKSLGKKLVNLVFRSRWERFLSLVR